ENHGVTGSIPVLGTKEPNKINSLRGTRRRGLILWTVVGCQRQEFDNRALPDAILGPPHHRFKSGSPPDGGTLLPRSSGTADGQRELRGRVGGADHCGAM